MALRTDYKDDILDTSVNTQRKYRMVTNDDGTVSFIDETVYTQNGDTFGAAEANQIHEAVNMVNDSLTVDTTNLSEDFSLNGLLQKLAEIYFVKEINFLKTAAKAWTVTEYLLGSASAVSTTNSFTINETKFYFETNGTSSTGSNIVSFLTYKEKLNFNGVSKLTIGGTWYASGYNAFSIQLYKDLPVNDLVSPVATLFSEGANAGTVSFSDAIDLSAYEDEYYLVVRVINYATEKRILTLTPFTLS